MKKKITSNVKTERLKIKKKKRSSEKKTKIQKGGKNSKKNLWQDYSDEHFF